MPSDTSLFHVGSLGLIDGDDAVAWEAFFERCHERGIVTSLDPNVRPGLIAKPDEYTARIRRMMRHTDIFKLSDEDLLWLYPNRALEEALKDFLADCKATLSILTMRKWFSLSFLAILK